MVDVLAHSPSGWLSCSISLSSTGKLILAKKPAGVGMRRGHTHFPHMNKKKHWHTCARKMYVHYLVTPEINSWAKYWAEAPWFWKKDSLTKGEGWRCGVIYNSIQCKWRGRVAHLLLCVCVCVCVVLAKVCVSGTDLWFLNIYVTSIATSSADIIQHLPFHWGRASLCHNHISRSLLSL